MFRRLVYSDTFSSRVRWFFLLILIPPFALSLWTWARPPSGSAAGVIFGREVPREAFQQAYLTIRRAIETQFGGEVPEQFEPFVQQQAWDRLILQEEARRTVRIDDEELAAYIRSQSAFQENGRFSQELYYRMALGMGVSPQVFEERVRDDLRVQRLLERVRAEVTLSDEELRAAYEKDRQRIRASLIVARASEFGPQVPTLTDEELRAHYAAHQPQWQEPARRIIEYLGLTHAQALAQQAEPSDEQLQTFYDEHEELFTNEDGSPKPLSEVRDQVREQARQERAAKQLTELSLDLQDDVDAGLRLVEIALSRERMLGRTDWISAATAQDIPDGPASHMLLAALETPLGGLTDVQRDATGTFLLRAVDEIPMRQRPFEEVIAEVEQQARAERLRTLAKERADALHQRLTELRGKGFTLDEACLSAGAERVFTEPFSRQEPIQPLGYEPGLAASLFGLALGGMTPVTETEEGFAIGFPEERLPPDEAAFEQEKESYRQTALQAKQQEQIGNWLSSLRTKANLKNFLEPPTQAQPL